GQRGLFESVPGGRRGGPPAAPDAGRGRHPARRLHAAKGCLRARLRVAAPAGLGAGAHPGDSPVAAERTDARGARNRVLALPFPSREFMTRAEAPRAATPAVPTGPVWYEGSPLTRDDIYLFNEGSHFRLYDKLGSHPHQVHGQAGTSFAVWAPNAE